MQIGEVIRKYRKERHMTQEEMVRRLGVTTPAVNKWENQNFYPEKKRKQAQIYSETGRTEEAYKAYEELLFSGYQMFSMVLNGLYMLAAECGQSGCIYRVSAV